jgi:mediator of RNA polymerase II transcription subunit 21
MNASLKYIRNRAPPGAIPGQPLLDTFAELEAKNAAQNLPNPANPAQQAPAESVAPPTQEEYQNDMKEMSRDMVLKEQQLEVLIASLPGLNTSEGEQVERMKALEAELAGLEGERVEAVREREALVRRVEERIRSVGSMR